MDAAEQDIKQQYRKLSTKYHPDKNPDNVQEAHTMFYTLKNA